MKTFEVELRRTSYITVTVEAENAEEAAGKAWHAVESGYFGNDDDASWDVESIEEIKHETQDK